MLSMLRNQWDSLRSNFWFLPGLIVAGAIGLALGLVSLESYFDLPFVKSWPLLFGAGAEGARGLLSAVAGSMITVAGVVFSITIVALSLTSSQYSSRVLRNFMDDRINQTVLGVFVGIFAYCLMVLRTIRSGDENGFVPSVAVLGGLVLAMVGIGFLIFFIHHIATMIQASSILAVICRETNATMDREYPVEVGAALYHETQARSVDDETDDWCAVLAPKTGYIRDIDGDALLAWASEHKTVIRIERAVGEFVAEGSKVLSVEPPLQVKDRDAARLCAAVHIDRQRDLHHDPAFGIRQIVDIALRALSPGINDTTTAVMCTNYLGAILARLGQRTIAPPHRSDGKVMRVIARGASFESLVAEAFDQIRRSADGNITVLGQLLLALELIAGVTTDAQRRRVLGEHAALIGSDARRAIRSPHDGETVEAALCRLSKMLPLEAS